MMELPHRLRVRRLPVRPLWKGRSLQLGTAFLAQIKRLCRIDSVITAKIQNRSESSFSFRQTSDTHFILFWLIPTRRIRSTETAIQKRLEEQVPRGRRAMVGAKYDGVPYTFRYITDAMSLDHLGSRRRDLQMFLCAIQLHFDRE